MTITTAKLARCVTQAWARPLALPLALSALLLAPSARAGWTFVPTLDVRETYTDNVALTAPDKAQGEFVTEITPGLLLQHKGPRLTARARYRLQYFPTPTRDINGTRRTSRQLQADAHAKLIDELLFVDAQASRAQQNVSPFGQLITDNNYATANRAEVSSWRISPYLRQRVGASATSEVRYTHDSVDAGRSGLGTSEGDTLSYSIDSGPAFRKLGWNFHASKQEIRDSVANNSTIQQANAGLRYKLTPTLNLTAGIGYDKYDYEAVGGVNGGSAWNAGLAWTPSRRTSVTASLGHRYYGPSRALKALHRSRHTSWNISYDDAVVSTRNNFLLPATIDTATLLDGLFAPAYPDPVERARAVEAYILATGLPQATAQNVNFFSNRYSLQKQLRASAAFRQGRTSAVFSVFKVRRDALSVRDADGALLGSTSNSVNDNIEQKGFTATLDYRLTGRTHLDLSSEITDNTSLSAGIKGRSSAVRFGVRHQLAAKMTGTLELRHIKGNTALLGGRTYTENALSAALSMQL